MITYAYIANADSKDITILSLDPESGALKAVETAVVARGGPAEGGSMPLAVSPDRRFLYAALRYEPFTAVAFAIGRDGRLTQIGNAPLPDSMAYLTTDRTGRHLLGSSYGGNKISVSAIGSGGIVSSTSTVTPTGKAAHMVLTSPDNRFVFATNLGSDAVARGRFDAATGAVSELTLTAATVAVSELTLTAATVKAGGGPRHFRFHPNGQFFYLLNELDAALTVYAYDGASGALTAMQSASALPAGFTGKPWGADLHLTQDGKWLYASERTSSTLAAFRLDGSGKMTAIGSFETERQPRGFAIDPTGRWLLSVGQVSHGLSVHKIDGATGTLTRVKQLPVGRNPQWVEIVEL